MTLAQRVKRFVARGVLPRVLTVLRKIAPTRAHVFVAGYPSTEGNAVEAVRALRERHPGRIDWADGPSDDYLEALGFTSEQRRGIHRVRKDSPRTIWSFVTAQAVFFTHGLYGEPAADPRKPIINLWHGGGMKRSQSLFPDRTLQSKPSDVIVGGSKLWGECTAQLSGLDGSETILSGYPRTDELFRPVDHDRLRALGIDGDRPFVVWMPSYRTARSAGTMRAFSDTADQVTDVALSRLFAEGVRSVTEQGITVVVKPHPLDAVARSTAGAILIDDAVLESAGVSLYRLLGASAALVTDTSSVWVDYLLRDRPIGFFFPDRAEYAHGRGFFPEDALDWLPGPFLDCPGAFRDFAADVLAGGEASRPLRDAACARGGIVSTKTAADDLVDRLAQSSGSRFVESLGPRIGRNTGSGE